MSFALLRGGAPERLLTEPAEVSNDWLRRGRDLDDSGADLQAQGVRFINEVLELTGSRLCSTIADPENRLVSVHDHPPDAIRAEAGRATPARAAAPSR